MSTIFFLDLFEAGRAATPAQFEAALRAEGRIDPADAAVTRGDGVFETLGVNDGAAHARDAHLRRLAHSARLLDLPEPHLGQWSHAIDAALAALPAEGPASIRLTLSRGVPGEGPTGWVVAARRDALAAERGRGAPIDVVLLERGLSVEAPTRAPWLLAGAKSLSYGVNMAALREARRRGADDAIFVAHEGFALEGPTSSLLIRAGERYLSPPVEEAILDGTTLADAFAGLRAEGLTCEYSRITVGQLLEADAAWLLSSVRLAAPVRRIDASDLEVDLELTARLNAVLSARER